MNINVNINTLRLISSNPTSADGRGRERKSVGVGYTFYAVTLHLYTDFCVWFRKYVFENTVIAMSLLGSSSRRLFTLHKVSSSAD